MLQCIGAAVHWCCSALVDLFALCLLGVLLLFDCCVAVVLLLCCCCVVVVVLCCCCVVALLLLCYCYVVIVSGCGLDCSDYSFSVYFFRKFHTDGQCHC